MWALVCGVAGVWRAARRVNVTAAEAPVEALLGVVVASSDSGVRGKASQLSVRIDVEMAGVEKFTWLRPNALVLF